MSLLNMLAALKPGDVGRLVLPLASNFIHLMLNRPDHLAPFYIAWLMSYRCNCRCLHCDWVWSRTGEDDLKRELTSEQRLQVADQIAASKTWGLTLSGGEPLLLPELPEVIRRLKSAKKVINLCTNGLLLSRLARDLIALGVDTITVSFDSHLPEEHDHLRGLKGTYAQALEGIAALRRLRSGKRPKIVVKGVISASNYTRLKEHVLRFRELSDETTFQPIQNNSLHQVKDGKLLFSDDHEAGFRQAIQELTSLAPEFNHIYYRRMADFIFHPDRLLQSGQFRCLFFSAFYFLIDPYGEAGGCFGHGSAGNLLQKNLTDLWRSKENFQFQQKIRSKDQNCICWSYLSYVNSYLVYLYNMSPWIPN